MGTYSKSKIKNNSINIYDYYSDLENAHSLKGIFNEKRTNKCKLCLQDGTLPICDPDITCNIAEVLKMLSHTEINKENARNSQEIKMRLYNREYLCLICYKFIRNMIFFRRLALQAEEALQQRLNCVNEFSEDDRII